MLKKLTILGAVSALMLSVPAPQARADVGFNFGLNTPQFGLFFGDGRHDRYRGDRHRYRYRKRHVRRIGCRQARHIVRRNGFHRIRATDCRGRIYTFRARRHGGLYRVRVNARGGYISRIRRLS